MKKIKLFATMTLLVVLQSVAFAHNEHSGNITGEVINEKGEHIPYATVMIEGTTIGGTTDGSGHYLLVGIHTKNKPYVVVAQAVGYKPQRIEVTVKPKVTSEANFTLQSDVLGLEEVVITGDRTARKRKESSVIVNTLSPKLLEMTQSNSFGEGLVFTPGVRMEDDCENCGASSLRMNGLEGSYTQILINSRPIFSGLAAVYGLEQIPASIIDRVEVVRGGGSALYGSNAIAGTINVILKDPTQDSFEAGINSAFTGIGVKDCGPIAGDHNANVSTSMVTSDNKTGMTLYGSWRDRKSFDANDDGFSERANLKSNSIGTRIFHRLGNRNKITFDAMNIREDRRGGDKFNSMEHFTGIAESLRHNILTGAVKYEQFCRNNDLWSVFASGQSVDRNSYYGGGHSIEDYGKTDDLTYTFGTQYTAQFEEAGTLTAGVEYVASNLTDVKLGYEILDANDNVLKSKDNEDIADQEMNTLGAFAQYEIKFDAFTASVGARVEKYEVKDNLGSAEKKDGTVFSPRVTLKYDITEYLQARASYSQGYRSPQIFNEDLHIETSAAKQIVHKNDPNLKQETSHSWMGSLDFNKQIGTTYVNFLVEGFYTKIDNAFADSFAEDANTPGLVVYERVNSENGAEVKGINLETNIIPMEELAFKAGFTIQNSEYGDKQDWDDVCFIKTPDTYGYFGLDYNPTHDLGISLTGTYTGKMNVMKTTDQNLTAQEQKEWDANKNADDESWILREADPFFDLGVKVHYDFHIGTSKMRLFTGMKNILNSYQDDFDKGEDRDAGYIYGPINPRTVYFGIKIGNLLK